jgi:U2 small nuclear ribonucleoprotein A'
LRTWAPRRCVPFVVAVALPIVVPPPLERSGNSTLDSPFPTRSAPLSHAAQPPPRTPTKTTTTNKQDQFASIDLCDNAVARLDGLPRLLRLRQLLLANNRIAKVAPGLGELLPGLHTLVLTNNRLAELRDLAPLAAFKKTLTLLSLRGNPCAARPGYRLYVISLLPALKVLDFTKVKAQEREAARKQFPEGCAAPAPPVGAAAAAANGGGGAAGAAAAAAAAGAGGAAAEDGGGRTEPPSQKQLMALQAAIAGAATLEEVERLEAALAAGTAAAAAAEDADAGGGG